MAAQECGGILRGGEKQNYSIFRTGIGGFTQRLQETHVEGKGAGSPGLLCYTTVRALEDVRFRLLPTVAPAFWRRYPPTQFGKDDLFVTQFSLHTSDDLIQDFFADEAIQQTLIAAGKVSVELRPYGLAYALVVGRPTKPRRLWDLISLFALLDQMIFALGKAELIENHATLQ